MTPEGPRGGPPDAAEGSNTLLPMETQRSGAVLGWIPVVFEGSSGVLRGGSGRVPTLLAATTCVGYKSGYKGRKSGYKGPKLGYK